MPSRHLTQFKKIKDARLVHAAREAWQPLETIPSE